MPKAADGEGKVKAPPSAYFLFQAEERPRVVEDQPELKGKVAEQAKVIGAKWKELTDEEKAPFEAKSKELKAEHEAKYGKSTKAKKEKDPNAPKRAPSAYMLFSSSERANIIAENPELRSKVTEVAKILGAKWQTLSEAAKAEWTRRAKASQ